VCKTVDLRVVHWQGTRHCTTDEASTTISHARRQSLHGLRERERDNGRETTDEAVERARQLGVIYRLNMQIKHATKAATRRSTTAG